MQQRSRSDHDPGNAISASVNEGGTRTQRNRNTEPAAPVASKTKTPKGGATPENDGKGDGLVTLVNVISYSNKYFLLRVQVTPKQLML